MKIRFTLPLDEDGHVVPYVVNNAATGELANDSFDGAHEIVLDLPPGVVIDVVTEEAPCPRP